MLLDKNTSVKATAFPDPTLILAYVKLCSFLQKSMGIPAAADGIQVHFHTGLPNGYTVKAENGTLVFSGKTAADCLYAVYAFAEEKLGCCFFEPGQASRYRQTGA